MPITGGTAKERFRQVMEEYKKKSLHAGKGGPKLRSRKQAVAIALNMERRRGSS